MDKMEAIYWLAIIRQAKEGDKEAQETLRVENQIRAENGQPTIEEELMALANK